MTPNDDPFVDPVGDVETHHLAEPLREDTLAVGRDASLTIGTDSLVVLDEGLKRRRRIPDCCGLLNSTSKTLRYLARFVVWVITGLTNLFFSTTKESLATRSIPLYNVLWAEVSEDEITIDYAHPISKRHVRRAFVNYHLEKCDRAKATAWAERLLGRAYGSATTQRQRRIKVLINPFGGQGKARKWYLRDIEPIFSAARCHIDVETTEYNGHAREIAERLDIDAYDVIACCSGDGVPHEVFNGLGRKADAARALAKLAVVQLPCGTGNAMSLNVNGTHSNSLAALAVVKGVRTPLDLVSITQGDRRTLSFLSQAVGIIAETDLGTENMRWMGDFRFIWGFLVRLMGKTVYPCEIALAVDDDSKDSIRSKVQQHMAQHAEAKPADLPDATPESRAPDPHAGLPELKFGTVQDALPDGWKMQPYPVMGNFYAGNMTWMSADAAMFQAALPSDGKIDLICIDGDISRWLSVKMLLAAGQGKIFDFKALSYRKLNAYRIIPHQRDGKDGYISIDGESVPFEPFQVEVHRALGTTISRRGWMYEAPGLG